MELTLGSRAVFQLQETFQCLNSQFDYEGVFPVANVSVEIARKLYHLYIKSVNLQKENQDKLLAMLNREDEIYARRLVQEDCKSEFGFLRTSNWSKKSNRTNFLYNTTSQINSRPNEYIELILDAQAITQLEAQFGDYSMIPEGFQPVVQVSLKLAEKLHLAYIQSVRLQKQNEEQILVAMAKQERKAAKKLRKQENQQSKTTTKPRTLDQDKEENKTINSMETTVKQNQTNLLFVQKLTSTVNITRATNKNTTNTNEARSVNVKKTVEKCRQEAQMFLEKQQELHSKAKQAYQQKNFYVAQHYSETARTYRNRHEEANEMAITLLMEEEKVKHSDVLDLHCFNVKEAMQSLNLYIDAKINLLQNSRRKMKRLSIIIGRGKHSANKKSKLGPAIQDLLRRRNIPFVQSDYNSGMLEIKVYSNTLLFHL